jgi:hypothetical protein
MAIARDYGSGDGPNWWVIGAFTAGGAALLTTAYYMSSYVQGVLDNVGTALLLFALLAFSGPKLIRHLRRPRTLDEALTRFAAVVGSLPQGATGDSTNVKDRVLKAVGRTGLHQEPPEPTSTRFTNLGGTVPVEWRVEWDEKGLRHLVTADSRNIPRALGGGIGWDEKIAAHEERVYQILCHLLHELERLPSA